MADDEEPKPIDMREQIIRIDHMLADIRRNDAVHNRTRQEIRYAPFLATIAGMTSGAALFAAGAAFMKFFGS